MIDRFALHLVPDAHAANAASALIELLRAVAESAGLERVGCFGPRLANGFMPTTRAMPAKARLRPSSAATIRA